MLQLEYFIKANSAKIDALHEYLFERVGDRTRLTRVLDLIMERDQVLVPTQTGYLTNGDERWTISGTNGSSEHNVRPVRLHQYQSRRSCGCSPDYVLKIRTVPCILHRIRSWM